MKKILLLGAFLVGFVWCQAQEEQKDSKSTSTKSQFEVGLHAGVPFIGGEVTPKFGYGGGIHVRLPLDHMFALRVEGLYAMAKGEQMNPARQFDNTWISGAVFGVLTLNNMRFDRPIRKNQSIHFGWSRI